MSSNQTSSDRSSPVDGAPPAAMTFQKRVMFVLGFIAQPLMFLSVGLILLALLGIAQRAGWISAGGSGNGEGAAVAAADVDYICPMMCTPPQKVPGRCPVCAMELVPASGGGAGGDERSVFVDPATRRVAHIQTASVQRIPMNRTIRAVGELNYDEGKMKTISAYTNGRFDRMYVDYNGAVVKKGDRLASFYSPDLYSAQVEFLQATDSQTRPASIAAVAAANKKLQTSARNRLSEFGMSETQIQQIANSRKALNRLDIVAPIHGTVIERLAVEGEYVKEGQAVFRLADLSTVWLMLELFPEDAANVRTGQAVEAKLKSLPGRIFNGRIAFVDPSVNQKSRTVSIRVVLKNEDGVLRIGDYAKATIEVPLGSANNQLGFADPTLTEETAFVIPRSAVLSAANQSVVYVETETGRFEIRRVVTGPTSGNNMVILKGLAEGEKVATSGTFLLDSQMQLAGNPSLIDPTRAAPPLEMVAGFAAKELAEIQQLPDDEQAIALAQVICPVTEYKLGSMGTPCKMSVNGETVFICCEACRDAVLEEPAIHLAKLQEYKSSGGASSKSMEPEEFEVPEIGEIQLIEIEGSD